MIGASVDVTEPQYDVKALQTLHINTTHMRQTKKKQTRRLKSNKMESVHARRQTQTFGRACSATGNETMMRR